MRNPKRTAPEQGGPSISIQRPCYTMASVDGTAADLVLYGEIVERRPVDWWTGEPEEGQYIIESEFLEDLRAVSGCRSLIIRMDSCGGDAGVSILIHNRLRELAAKGMELTCIVDGVAMSGGSLIMSACDTVRMNPASLVMIHKSWTFLFGGYNADELQQQAAQNQAYDRAQAAIYARKTGLPEEEILRMMGETTYMTGKEAVEKGFADALLEDAAPLDIAASADGRSLFVRGREMRLTSGLFAPDHIPTVAAGKPPEQTHRKQPGPTGSLEGGKRPMVNTLAELRAAYPELTAELETEARAAGAADAVNAEQRRLQEIDEVAGLFDDELVQAAKYGADACTAQEFTYRAAQKATQQGRNFLTAMEADTAASGVGSIGAAPGEVEVPAPEELQPDQRLAQAKAEIQKLFGKNKEG